MSETTEIQTPAQILSAMIDASEITVTPEMIKACYKRARDLQPGDVVKVKHSDTRAVVVTVRNGQATLAGYSYPYPVRRLALIAPAGSPQAESFATLEEASES